MMHPLTLLVIALWLLCLAVRAAESRTCCAFWGELRRLWRAMGVPGRVVAVLAVAIAAQSAGSKGVSPVAKLYSAIFWHPETAWALAGPDADVRAAQASLGSASNDLAAASAALESVAAVVDTQSVWSVSCGWPMRDRTPEHATQNVLGENPWRSNVWINGELYHDHYVAFNASVGTNPAILSIDYTARQNDGSLARWLASVTTNSYPQKSVLHLEHGAYTCYWFRCKVPEAITNCVIDWDREVIFGAPTGTGRGFNIAGVFVVSKDGELWQGRTYTNVVDGATNVVINGIRVEENGQQGLTGGQ